MGKMMIVRLGINWAIVHMLRMCASVVCEAALVHILYSQDFNMHSVLRNMEQFLF